MGKTITPFMIATGLILAFTGAARGQEVNSDVNIPFPRELVSGAPAINGLFGGTTALFSSSLRLFQESSAQAEAATLNEEQTREELGDFMTSLLVRAGIIAFDRAATDVAASGGNSENGSRPAWVGRTPLTLSVSRTGRSEFVERRSVTIRSYGRGNRGR